MAHQTAQYDRPEFFTEYMKLPRQVKGHDGASEWPLLREMVGSVSKNTVLDLGCGLGWFSRYAIENGALSVDSIDISAKMISRAKKMTSSEDMQRKITYAIQDLNTIDLEENRYDLVYSSLTIHYLSNESYTRLLEQIHTALKPGGRLVFSIEHPIYTAPSNPMMQVQDNTSVWPLNLYAVEGVRNSEWLGGITKYHRTLSTYLQGLMESGFVLRDFREWMTYNKYLMLDEEANEEFSRPMFALVGAVKE